MNVEDHQNKGPFKFISKNNHLPTKMDFFKDIYAYFFWGVGGVDPEILGISTPKKKQKECLKQRRLFLKRKLLNAA